MPNNFTKEHNRLAEHDSRAVDWKQWGPYVAERAWGTVREDYSEDGRAWESFPHDHARSRAYRWNEDGLAGVCNRYQNICMALGLWNGKDPILKERLFGLTGPEGNHGEDVKEYYFYLDNVPTHSYMKYLYKYPQVEYPYAKLVDANRKQGRDKPEVELLDLLGDTFKTNRYFDVTVEYAKADEEDVLCRITVENRGPEAAPLHILPQLWYRNTWSWGYDSTRPTIRAIGERVAETEHRHLGKRWWYVDAPTMPAGPPASGQDGSAPMRLMFTENDTNRQRLYGKKNAMPYVKDAFHEAVCRGKLEALNPARKGTKAAAHFQVVLPPGGKYVVQTRLSPRQVDAPFADFDAVFDARRNEADAFYDAVGCPGLDADQKRVERQAYAGLLWTKQFYHYSVELWLDGDPVGPRSPESAEHMRNHQWRHMYNLDIISMPDKWEYPWYAAWDLAYHCLPLAQIDPKFAKRQLMLMLREWYMHPNGQMPAYEWNFSDVNPPVHAWACWRVYKISRNITGEADTRWLEEVFQKLLLNFTWWVNRKDRDGANVFEGGFLGLDNIGVFDRSSLLAGRYIEQADGTAWMGMYCLNMLAIALELARTRPAYESIATKFFEHFIYIANAINAPIEEQGLWDAEDGFFYDKLHLPEGTAVPLKLRSFVGLIPLFAVETIEPDLLEMLPNFRRRMEWFIKYRPKLTAAVASLTEPGENGRLLLTIVDRYKLERILPRMFDPSQFLSEFGLRSLSHQMATEPFVFKNGTEQIRVDYEPGESRSDMFGGNSNWRGPIWFPVNYLMIESLEKYHHYFGDTLKVESPRYSGVWMNLQDAAKELSRRMCSLFLRDEKAGGRRAVFGDVELFQKSPEWRDHIPFYEYFHGETGRGMGASHQTGWTALVARMLSAIVPEK
ncbi:MAG: glucosidase [Planctomycetia bacterium]|nr:glucosidase [Planctomycetia bacterium]